MIAPLDPTATSDRRRKSKKSVSWDAVEIREYPVVLSANPSTKLGPSLELGWDYCMADTIELILHDEETGMVAMEPYLIEDGQTTVDHYEAVRPSERRHHKVLREMYLNSHEREALLEKYYTAEEIKQAVEEKTELARTRSTSKYFPTAWSRSRPKRIRKVKRAVKNLNQKQIPKNIYALWWLPLEISL